MGILEFLGAVGRVIAGVLGLDVGNADWIAQHPQRLGIAVAVAVLAGISTLLGDAVVIFFNRLRGWRFALTLGLNGLGMVLLYLVQAVVIYLVGPLISGFYPGFTAVVTAVLLATAPLVFRVFALVPYAGPAIAGFLQVWGMVALWVIVDVVFHTDHWTALWITLISWLCMQVLSRAFAVPIRWIGDRIWRLVSGQPSMITGSDLMSGQLFLPLGQRFDPEVEA